MLHFIITQTYACLHADIKLKVNQKIQKQKQTGEIEDIYWSFFSKRSI